MKTEERTDGIQIVVWSPTCKVSWVERDFERVKQFTNEAMRFAWESEQLKKVIDYEI